MIRDALREALATLRTQRGRSLMTLFGVVWGTAAVVFLMAWGEGLALMIETSMTRVGKDMGIIWAGRIGEDFTPAADRRWLWLTRRDARMLEARGRLIGPVAAEVSDFAVVSHGQHASSEDLRGVEPPIFELRGVRLAEGRPLTQDDVEHRRRVVVLGSKVRRTILGASVGVGAQLRIEGRSFEVVGVLARVGTQLWRDSSEIDDQIWIPITSFLALRPSRVQDADAIENLLFRFPGRAAWDAAKAEARAILSERLRVSPEDEEAIYVVSPTEILRQMPIDAMQTVLLVLAAATLGIGGVGVMNMMLDSVHERRSEIGVRLAVGARRRDVVMQFFLETLALTGAGGVVGIGLGVGGAALLGAFEMPDLIPVPILRLPVVAFAFGAMALVGVSAGVVPAWRAARVDPAEILRVE